MPAVLSDKRFPNARAPAAWEGGLEDLAAFEGLCRDIHEQGKTKASAADKLRAAELHDGLLLRARELIEPRALADVTEADTARIFARSVLFVTRLRSCITAERDFLDTAGSKTLDLYRPDYDGPAPEELAPVLERAFGLSTKTIEEIEREVHADLADARDRRAAPSRRAPLREFIHSSSSSMRV